jgi:RimJ/RimL family protein N-acetyltransferase
VSVSLRPVQVADLEAFFEHQRDPEAIAMAAFAARERPAFMAHWERILADPTVIARTIVADDEVAGNLGSFEREGLREVGYWIARSHWGRGVATAALAQFLDVETHRPLHARVATHNPGSRRVLEKCGFTVLREIPDPEGDGVDEVLLRLT